MARIALCFVVPVTRVQAEKELDVPEGVGLGAEHVAEEEVAELHRAGSGEQQAEVALDEPPAAAWVEEGRWAEEEHD